MFTENGCDSFSDDSAREARRIVSDRQLKRAYTTFFLTPEGRAFVRKFGRSYLEPAPRLNGSIPDPEFHDPADLPIFSAWDSPLDHIEPLDSHIPMRGMDRKEINLVCETFKSAFRWALDGAKQANGTSPLVCVGERCNVVLSRMRQDLGSRLYLERHLCRSFDRNFNQKALLLTGVRFGRALEWMRRGDPISARGARVYVVAYQLWANDINAATLAHLGAMNEKTRQAIDKQANCLRDTIKRLQARTMRANQTRSTCRSSQYFAPTTAFGALI